MPSIFFACIIDKRLSVNHLYATDRTGKRRLTKAARKMKDDIILFVNEQNRTKKIEKGPISIEIRAISNWLQKDGQPKKKDISNIIKLVEDAVCKALGIDDKWVWEIVARKIMHISIDGEEGMEIIWHETSERKGLLSCGFVTHA